MQKNIAVGMLTGWVYTFARRTMTQITTKGGQQFKKASVAGSFF